MKSEIQDHSTAGGASWSSQLAPCSFYLAIGASEVTTTTKLKKPFTRKSLQNRHIRRKLEKLEPLKTKDKKKQ